MSIHEQLSSGNRASSSFGSLTGHSEIAGLFERLSTAVNSILGLLLIGRLLLMARAGRNQELSYQK